MIATRTSIGKLAEIAIRNRSNGQKRGRPRADGSAATAQGRASSEEWSCMNSLAMSAGAGPQRTAIYVRVSTPGQEEHGTSLETQEAACRQYASQQGFAVDQAHVYREVHTGIELWERPQLQRLREAVRCRQLDAVIAYSIDRLARDPVHLGVIISEAEHADVQVQFVSEPLDNTPEGQLIRYIRGYAAKVEHEKIRERSIRAKLARAQAGKLYNYGRELYGYRRDKEHGVRSLHGPEADIVRSIFEKIAVGRGSIRSVARQLNDEGVPGPSNGHWGKSTIHRIVAEPAYMGQPYAWRWKRTKDRKVTLRPESEWIALAKETTPAIVTPELWQAANARSKENRPETKRNQARPYLLRGLMLCGVCGRKMRTTPEKGRRVYRCASRETPSGPCGGKRVRADEIEAWVWDQVCRVLGDPLTIAKELKRQRESRPEGALATVVDACKRTLAKIEKQQHRLISTFRTKDDDDDGVAWELLRREIEQAEQEKARTVKTMADAEQRLAEQRAALERLEALTVYCAHVAQNLDNFGFNQKRLALEALAVQVVANGRDWQLGGGVPTDDLPTEKDAGILVTSYS